MGSAISDAKHTGWYLSAYYSTTSPLIVSKLHTHSSHHARPFISDHVSQPQSVSSPRMGSLASAALVVSLITQPYAGGSSWAQDEGPQASHKPALSQETRNTSSMLPAGQGEKYSTAAKPDSADGQNTSPVFAQGEMHRRRAHLAEAELRLQRYKQDHNVSSLKDQRRLLLEQHTALSTNLKTILNQAAGFREKLSWLQTRKATLEETIPLSTLTDQQRMLDEAKEEQLRLQLKEQELLMKFQEGNRQVHTTRREIDLVGAFIADQEKRLQKHVTTGKNPVYLELELELLRTEADLRASEAQAEVIKQQLEDSQQAILLLDSRERTLVELQRDVAISESLYYDYVTRAGLYPGQDYRVQVGDHLEVKFFYNPELNQMVSVRRDGRIALQLVGEVDAAGATVEELTRELMIRYRDEVKHPKITVMVDTSRPHLQRDFYRPGVAESAK